jgi:hypothetical protein
MVLMKKLIYLSLMFIQVIYGCASNIKMQQTFLWNDVDKDAILFCKQVIGDTGSSCEYEISSKTVDISEICKIKIGSKNCYDVEYYLEVDLKNKRVIKFE